VEFGSLLLSVHQVLAQSILHHGIQLNLMFLGIERGPLVEVLRYPDIEAALEWGVWSLAPALTKQEILVDCIAKVLFQGPHIRATIADHVANAEDTPVKHLVLGAVQNRAIVSAML
jgi:hypothetical protein